MMRTSQVQQSNSSIAAIDFFCGAGGLTKGLEKAGIEVRLGIDTDPACAYPFEANNESRFLNAPVESLSARSMSGILRGSPIRLLAGCAPCQPFSTYSQGRDDSTDYRGTLLSAFAAHVQHVKPELVTMENVAGLSEKPIFRRFVDELLSLQYAVTWKVVNCSTYGVPQSRERLVLLASRLGTPELIAPTHRGRKVRTVRDAIGKLPRLNAGMTDTRDPMHSACGLSALNLERIRASKPGGSWKDWDARLVSDCHRRASGRKYSSIYGRMKWDEPAPTLTTQFYNYGSGRYGHPIQDRAISFREGALLQTFPRHYRFFERPNDITRQSLGRLIGNAVPVRIGEIIGRSLIRHVMQHA